LAVIDAIGDSVRRYGRPVLIHSMSNQSAAIERMWARGLPTSTRIEQVVRTLQSAHALSAVSGRDLTAPAATSTPIGDGYWGARQVLSAHGLTVPRGMLVRQRTDLHSI